LGEVGILPPQRVTAVADRVCSRHEQVPGFGSAAPLILTVSAVAADGTFTIGSAVVAGGTVEAGSARTPRARGT